MADEAVDVERVKKEIAYYKRRLDELAADNLKHEYTISALQHQLRQKRQGFSLLSELSRTVTAHKEVEAIFDLTLRGIDATLGMDRAVWLAPAGEPGHFEPRSWIGYREEGSRPRPGAIPFPTEFAQPTAALLANGAAEATPLAVALREALGLPFLLCVPVMVDAAPIGLLAAGRVREAKPKSPPLDPGDVDTFQSIAALISATIRNFRVSVLEEMDRLKTDFFANISHEFRTPITLTLGPLDGILSGRFGEVDPRVLEQVDRMARNQRRLLGLINQILDLSKLEAKRMKLRAALVRDPNRFVRDCAEAFRTLSEERGLELKLSLDPRVSETPLYLDREKVEKVLFNLLSNAHKFTQRGSIEVRTALDGGVVQVAVADTGQGIREDQLPHVFDRFRQAEGSASKEYAGTGIGLALVKEFAELHGGEATVRSVYGEGTTFSVTFRVGREHLDDDSILDAPAEAPAVAPKRSADEVVPTRSTGETGDPEVEFQNALQERALDPAKATILYTDDNAELRAYLRDLLSPHYNVFLAVNGKDGLEKARRYRPDFLLSDLMMPVMNGTQFCQAVRQDPELSELPFVMLTAKTNLESKIEGLEEGADDYLGKPFSEAELLARVKNLVLLRKNQLRLRRELQAARSIQRALLPPARQAFVGADVEALYHPCEELSGDLFDTITHGRWLYVFVADVMSHGTASAQVTYLLKGLFRQALDAPSPPPLDELMRFLAPRYASYGLEYDVGIQVCRLQLETREVEYVRGNAPPAVWLTASGSRLLQPAPGPSLGRELGGGGPVPEFPLARDALAPGDALFLFTDGCYEFPSARGLFGLPRFCKLLAGQRSAEWTDAVLGALARENRGGRFDDDLTAVRVAVR